MLHLVIEKTLSQAVVDRIAAGDDVILQGGAVWAAYSGHADNGKLQQLIKHGSSVFAMQDMLAVSGIAVKQLLPGVAAIDYAEFVELTVKNPQIQTWC